jgi:nucleotide-binding universal stress UspA family protein
MIVIAGITPSPLSEVVTEVAVHEAKLRAAELLLVSNVANPRSGEAALDHTSERQKREAWLGEIAARARSAGVEQVDTLVPTTPGDLAEAVLELDRREDVGLIVIGIPRRSRVGKAVLGSASQDILLNSNHHVLGVKLPKGVDD